MERLTIRLPRQLSVRVTRLAKRRHVSRSELVREALELLVSGGKGETFVDRVNRYVGAGTDLPADILINPKHGKGYGS